MAAFEPQQILDYLDSALSDGYLFDQLHGFVRGTRSASNRARRRGARDQKAQRSAYQALTALVAAAREARQPAPPRRHRMRRAVILVGVTVAGIAAAQRSKTHPMWQKASVSADQETATTTT